MTLVPMITLADGARIAGVGSKTLRRWLRVDLGIVFGPPQRGARRLIRKSDLETVIRIHSGRQNWTLARREKGKPQ